MEPTTADSTKPVQQMEPGMSVVIGLTLGLAATFMLLTIIDHIKIGVASVHWPMTRGAVLHSEIVKSDGDYGESMSYEYLVDGISYRGNHVDWSDGSQTTAETNARRHRPGAELPVYYDPVNPGQSVLQKGIDSGLWCVIPTVAIFGLVSVVGIWDGLRRRLQAGHVQDAAVQR